MVKKKESIVDKIDSNPIKSMLASASTSFAFCFAVMHFYYTNRIDDIKDRYSDKIEHIEKSFQIELNFKILEVQQQEREKYYQVVDENSVNGEMLIRILKYYEKEGVENEK